MLLLQIHQQWPAESCKYATHVLDLLWYLLV